jgi:hypothetical protein
MNGERVQSRRADENRNTVARALGVPHGQIAQEIVPKTEALPPMRLMGLLICLIRAAGAQIRASFGVVRYEALPDRAFDRRRGPSFNEDLGFDVVHLVTSLSFLDFRS